MYMSICTCTHWVTHMYIYMYMYIHIRLLTHDCTCTCTGIALFEVDSKEHVRKYEDVDALSVFQYREKIKGQPPAFLQCGGFVYPLIPGKSPILKTGDKVYMIPELKNDGMVCVCVREREREREGERGPLHNVLVDSIVHVHCTLILSLSFLSWYMYMCSLSPTDGSTVGVVLDSASDEEIAQLDALLSQLADLRTVDITATVEKERKRDGEMVSTAEDKAPPTWGSSVAGVSETDFTAILSTYIFLREPWYQAR